MIDSANSVGRFPDFIEAPDDDQAISAAVDLVNGQAAELWLGSRFVATINGEVQAGGRSNLP